MLVLFEMIYSLRRPGIACTFAATIAKPSQVVATRHSPVQTTSPRLASEKALKVVVPLARAPSAAAIPLIMFDLRFKLFNVVFPTR